MHDLTALGNRIKKAFRARKAWAKRLNVEAYRVYDMDIPELRYTVDLYGEEAVVYDKRSKDEADDPALDWALCEAVASGLSLDQKKIHLKRRRRMRTEDGDQQYERLSETRRFFPVREGNLTFLVNLDDYLDTGLFLDHRPLRAEFQKLPEGTKFLNLFCYTGSVSVAAAKGGATTTSVDMSNTYLEWAAQNFAANGMKAGEPGGHRLVRADALRFIEQGPSGRERFDVIFLDPPTYSNSKRMDETFDVQRDHARVIQGVTRFLAPNGTLYFSTNRQRFSLDEAITNAFAVNDITERTVPEDFRNRTAHRCFEIRAKGQSRG